MRTRHLSAGPLLVSALLLQSGCRLGHRDLTQQNHYRIETHPGHAVEIPWAAVHTGGDAVSVDGTLRRRHAAATPLVGHIGLRVLTEDGRCLYTAHSRDLSLPRRRVGQRPNSVHFSVPLEAPPPTGAGIEITWHTGREP